MHLALGDNISTLELEDNMNRIVCKLPVHLRDKWVTERVINEKKHGRIASFGSLVEFVKLHAKIEANKVDMDDMFKLEARMEKNLTTGTESDSHVKKTFGMVN